MSEPPLHTLDKGMTPFFPTTDYYQAVNNNEQFWSECQSLSDFVLGAEYSL